MSFDRDVDVGARQLRPSDQREESSFGLRASERRPVEAGDELAEETRSRTTGIAVENRLHLRRPR